MTAQNFSLSPSELPFLPVQSGELAFADVDGDGDQDVLIAGRESVAVDLSELYLNVGAASSVEGAIEISYQPTLYPNPITDDRVNLHFTALSRELLPLRIFNVEGKQVLARTLSVVPGENTFEVPVSHLASGVYQVRLGDSAGGSLVIGR